MKILLILIFLVAGAGATLCIFPLFRPSHGVPDPHHWRVCTHFGHYDCDEQPDLLRHGRTSFIDSETKQTVYVFGDFDVIELP